MTYSYIRRAVHLMTHLRVCARTPFRPCVLPYVDYMTTQSLYLSLSTAPPLPQFLPMFLLPTVWHLSIMCCPNLKLSVYLVLPFPLQPCSYPSLGFSLHSFLHVHSVLFSYLLICLPRHLSLHLQ